MSRVVNQAQMRQCADMTTDDPAPNSAIREGRNYSIAMEEGRRALDVQRDDFKSVRDRSIAILGIASVSASIVGGNGASSEHRPMSNWLLGGAICLGLVILLCLGVAWPRTMIFSQNVETIVGWSDTGEDVSEAVVQRQLALYMQQQHDNNKQPLDWMYICFRIEIALLIAQLVLLGIDLWR
jgi:hypothetical protein